ncbi:hypothetical protein M405DRAFT_885485 [Rhizopogon salebrosus TDB-379]|nr:hypothetical protein M405DRAFT_885485 [Rhizopogon salebrosus TDB-379]
MSQLETTTSIAEDVINFCFPVRELESDRVKLIPFIPDLHADIYFQGSAAHPELYDFTPWGPFSDVSDFVEQLGLGLRRVQWQASELNTKSLGVAQKLGLKLEAILRWNRVLPASKASVSNGGKEREGDPRPGTVGRDTAMLAICWDDWENERARVLHAMDRRS